MMMMMMLIVLRHKIKVIGEVDDQDNDIDNGGVRLIDSDDGDDDRDDEDDEDDS